MKKHLALLILFAIAGSANCQTWVDSLYAVQTYSDVPYGIATDFAGNTRILTMDVSVPLGDTPPVCGRPLMVLVHGGAFIAGTKNDPSINAMREDFAARGYVTASINYRLGMFQTSSAVHCNITFVTGVEWDCLNQADTLEWSRAVFRGVQDGKGAIRYMINNASAFNIDPNNVFVVGESAGGFIALGMGFMDDPSEYPTGVGVLPDALPPNATFYETNCIQRYGMDTSIASMDLQRPDLGSVEGTLNPTTYPYHIRGVGSIYGASLTNYFQTYADSVVPALYLYHQPGDLVVPYNKNRVLNGYAACATTLGCMWIINRPFCSGGKAIADLIRARVAGGLTAPVMMFDSTLNNADCATQILNPSLTGHMIDNYTLRTTNLATFFSTKIVGATPCLPTIVEAARPQSPFTVFPQPTEGILHVRAEKMPIQSIRIIDLAGKVVQSFDMQHETFESEFELDATLADGIYLLQVKLADRSISHHRIILNR